MPGIPDQSPDVTALLLAWRGGDEAALGRIVPLVHDELRKIARRCLRGEHAAQSLQATALVNEAYLRLVDARLGSSPFARSFCVKIGAPRAAISDPDRRFSIWMTPRRTGAR